MQRLALIFAVFVFSVAATLSPASAQSSDGMVQVEDIVIEGNRRVAESTIRSYLPVQVGDRDSPDALRSPAEFHIGGMVAGLKVSIQASLPPRPNS